MTMNAAHVQNPAPTGHPAAFDAENHARAAGRTGLRLLLLWQFARTAFRLGFAAATAMLVGTLIMGGSADLWMAAAPPLLLATAALSGFCAERAQARTETRVAAELRQTAAGTLANMDARTLRALPAGTLSLSMQRHPAAVAALVTGHRAATMMMAIGPLMAAAALFWVSWQAALLMLGLTPVMILFFALVGETIRSRAEHQERAFGRLAGQFADRVRTLPTILANHALESEQTKLTGRLTAYADKTFAVLRVAFLNAAIIDFFASLSIAMLAVFLGLGHLKLAMIPGFSDLQLWQSLFILMIAPEYFAPFRRFSEQYHAKAEGRAAAEALDRLLSTAPPAMPAIPAVDRAIADVNLPPHGLVAITGPSGSGKSTLLRRLAGLEHPDGQPNVLSGCEIIWVAGDSYISESRLRDAIGWNGDSRVEDVRAAASAVGLLEDSLLPGGLDAEIEAGGRNLSGGQRLRITTARALLSSRTVFADEPTAKLDADTATAIRAALLEIARTRLVLAATHDPELIRHADLRIGLQAQATEQAA